MESELKLLMQRTEDVLGVGWDQQISGRQLKRICDELLSRLDTAGIFRGWVKRVEKEVTRNRGKHRQLSYLMAIKNHHTTNTLMLEVNYSNTSVDLFKEVSERTCERATTWTFEHPVGATTWTRYGRLKFAK